jgi:serine/threonine protein kinase
VRTIGRLEHPNIVPIHDVGVDADGRYFLVMKYIDGETIENIIDRLKRGDPEAVAHYDIQRRVQIFKGLLRALEYAHAQGYIHRDVKPANVMVGRFGEVVLMDWGVAFDERARRPADAASDFNAGETLVNGATGGGDRLSSTQAGALVGTPHYMSPEQARGDNAQVGARSDLYSACVLFHELLGLKHRHGHLKTLMSVLVAVNTGPPPKVATMFEAHPSQPDGIPGEYGHLLVRGLQREPEARWQSARELIDELDAIERGECRVQCPITFTKRNISRTTKLLDRHPLFGTVAINLGVVVFVALLVHSAVSLFS